VLVIALGEIPSVIYNCKELMYLDLSTNPLGRYVCNTASLICLTHNSMYAYACVLVCMYSVYVQCVCAGVCV